MIPDDDRLLRELVVLGAHLHWPLSELLDLDRATRHRVLEILRSEEG